MATNGTDTVMTIHPTIQRTIPNDVVVKPLFVRKAEPGQREFIEELDQMKKIARTIPLGTILVYTGKDTQKFINFTPIWHGDIVVVVGRRHGKIAVEVCFTSGELCGINIYDLAYEIE
jgi:hypothetical protein